MTLTNERSVFPGTILPVDWLDHSLKNMAVTEAAIKDSQTLRDKMCVTIQVMKNAEDIVSATNSMIIIILCQDFFRIQILALWSKGS